MKLVPAFLILAASAAQAAQLSTDARSAIPHNVQQLVVMDYRAMQNSSIAMKLKDRVMPPDLKQFDEALTKSGFNDNHDVEQLAFALFRTSESGEGVMMVGVAQGQLPMQQILANFRKQKIKPTVLRANKIYPMGKAGMLVCFVDSSTMVFGSSSAVTKALDARDGLSPNMLSNSTIMDAMHSVDSEPLWSILDAKGSQTMTKQLLGEAGGLADYESVKKRIQTAWYSMNFQHGVRFNMTLATGDTLTAVTVSSLLNAAVVVRKMSGSEAEKQALADTTIESNSGKLTVRFAATDAQFAGLLQSPLFKSMVR